MEPAVFQKEVINCAISKNFFRSLNNKCHSFRPSGRDLICIQKFSANN